MATGAPQAVNFWPLLTYLIGVLLVIGVMIGLSYFLGQRHTDRATNQPYESGILTTGEARIRFSIQFYLIAMFFVIFDLEAVFLFAWAVAVPELGWPGYFEVLVFIGVLIATLTYLWRIGGLNFGPVIRTAEQQIKQQMQTGL